VQRSLNRICVLLLGLQAAVFAAACSSSSLHDAPSSSGGTGGTSGNGGTGAVGGDGAGGTGVSGTGGAGGTTSGHAWLDDPDVWTPLPGQESWDDLCSYASADPDRIGFPALEWEPCGEGCSRAELGQGYFERSTALALSTTADGEPHVLLTQGAKGNPVWFERILDLNSGKTIAAVRAVKNGMLVIDGSAYTPCSGAYYTRNGLEFGAGRSFRDGRPHVHLRGSWQLDSKSWLWQLPWPTTADRGFSTDYCNALSMEAGGRTFWLCLDGLYGAIDPGSSRHERLETFDDGFIGARLGDGLGDLIAWQELRRGEVGSRVRGWRPDGQGVRTLLGDIPVDTCSVGLSPTHVGGFSNVGCNYGPEGRLWIARRGEGDTLTDFQLGPIVSAERIAVSVKPLKVWGDFLAVGWGPEEYETLPDRGHLYIARTTDWSIRKIPNQPGHEGGAATLTDEYVYTVPTNPATRLSTHIYRYELAKFEQLGEPVETVAEPARAASTRRRR